MPILLPYSHGVKRAGPAHLHSCRLHVCLFCFFPQGAPPALGQLWKSCRWWCSRAESVSQGGGSGCRPEVSNRHAESKTGGTSPRRAARRSGPALRAGNTPAIHMLPGQIWFRSGMCVTVAQFTRIRLTAWLLIHVLQECLFYLVKCRSRPFFWNSRNWLDHNF